MLLGYTAELMGNLQAKWLLARSMENFHESSDDFYGHGTSRLHPSTNGKQADLRPKDIITLESVASSVNYLAGSRQ